MSSTSLHALWSQRAFVRLWFARLAGTSANQMLMLVLGWQMYELTASAWDLGLVGLFQFLPALLLALVAGHVVDRFHRARIVAACLGLQGLVAALMLLGNQGHWLTRGLLLGTAVLLGTARAFQMPAQQALTPSLVSRDMLPRATAFSSAGMQVAIIAGPALGGLLYAVGSQWVYACALVLLVIGVALLLSLRYEQPVNEREPVTVASLLAGVHFIWQRPVILGAVSLDLFAVLLGGATALLPMFAKDILHVGASGLGLLRAAPAAGALLTSVGLSYWTLQRRVGHKLLFAVALYGVATLGFGLSTWFWPSLLMLALSGCADMVSVVVRQSLVQLDTPDGMRGRVGAVNSVFIGASNQLGEFESGATAALLGPVGSVILGGLGTLLVAALWWRLFPALARRDQLSQAAD